jgi:hypothetical protein
VLEPPPRPTQPRRPSPRCVGTHSSDVLSYALPLRPRSERLDRPPEERREPIGCARAGRRRPLSAEWTRGSVEALDIGSRHRGESFAQLRKEVRWLTSRPSDIPGVHGELGAPHVNETFRAQHREGCLHGNLASQQVRQSCADLKKRVIECPQRISGKVVLLVPRPVLVASPRKRARFPVTT